MTVLRDGRVVRHIRIAVGRAATATPVGLFAVTDVMRIAGGSSAYGCCALPITGHAPNVAPDRNRLGIHGTSAEGTIGSAASSGCLRGRGVDMRWLASRITAGTPLRIRP
jgi:lipoprotein-anchoring transpeptidase ErfK/SrfK